MSNRFSALLQFYGLTLDLFALNAIYLIAKYLMQQTIGHDNAEYVYFQAALNGAWILTSWLNNLYSEAVTSFEAFSRRTVQTYLYALALVLAYLFFSRQLGLSRLFIITILSSYGVMLTVNRFLFLLVRTYMRNRNLLMRRVVIIGYNETAKKLTSYLEEENSLTEIVGYCETEHKVTELTHYPVLASQEKAFDVSLQYGVDEILSTIAPEHNFFIYQLMKKAEQACIRFRFIPDLSHFINGSFHVDYLRDIPIISRRKEPLDDSVNRIKKRLLDVVVSSLVIVFVLSWLVPLLGLLIWLESPGPVFFRQKRSGRNNVPFDCFKFRSMKVNHEANSKQATKNDSRITRVGRFIRKTSLDEFPQFINVLRGEMSLVGPRPHMLKHTDEFSRQLDEFMVRHFVKPGITGWAQVAGYRGETSTLAQIQGRVERDIWYLENWSLLLDLKIMFLTVYNIFRGEKNAF